MFYGISAALFTVSFGIFGNFGIFGAICPVFIPKLSKLSKLPKKRWKPPPEMSRTPAAAPRRVPYAVIWANFSVPSTLVNFQPSQSPPEIAVL